MRSLFQAAKAFVKRQKKTRCSFAPGRFPVYNLMKSFRICGSIITAFSYIAAAFFYWQYKSANIPTIHKEHKNEFVEYFQNPRLQPNYLFSTCYRHIVLHYQRIKPFTHTITSRFVDFFYMKKILFFWKKVLGSHLLANHLPNKRKISAWMQQPERADMSRPEFMQWSYWP